MIQALCLLLGVLTAASAADVPLTWRIPESNQPYPTEFINLGDSITFNWQGLHGVYLLQNGPSVGCPEEFDRTSPANVAPVAPGGSYVWSPTEAGVYNLACQVGDHCTEGMLIQVVVGSGPALAPGAEAPTAPSTAPSSAEGSDEGSEGSSGS